MMTNYMNICEPLLTALVLQNHCHLYLCSISKDEKPDMTFLTQQQVEMPDLGVARAWPEETPVA